MTLEELEKVLVHPGIELLPTPEEEGELNRNRKFIIDNQVYTIEWWINICYLWAGGLMVCFHDIAVNGHWPNHHKNNLVFLDANGGTLAVIRIEKH